MSQDCLENVFFIEKTREKRESKAKKIRKTHNPKNFKHSEKNLHLNEKKEKNSKKEQKLEKISVEKEENDSYYEENVINQNENSLQMSNVKASISHSDHLEEIDAEEKNLLNLNLSFIKKEEDG